jgi:hypothetical protein
MDCHNSEKKNSVPLFHTLRYEEIQPGRRRHQNYAGMTGRDNLNYTPHNLWIL